MTPASSELRPRAKGPWHWQRLEPLACRRVSAEARRHEEEEGELLPAPAQCLSKPGGHIQLRGPKLEPWGPAATRGEGDVEGRLWGMWGRGQGPGEMISEEEEELAPAQGSLPIPAPAPLPRAEPGRPSLPWFHSPHA